MNGPGQRHEQEEVSYCPFTMENVILKAMGILNDHNDNLNHNYTTMKKIKNKKKKIKINK